MIRWEQMSLKGVCLSVCLSVCTSWQGKQSMPGNSSRSPVWALKQAPCHGQRTVWPVITPEHTVKYKVHVDKTQQYGGQTSCQRLKCVHPLLFFTNSHLVPLYLCWVALRSAYTGYRWHCICPHSVSTARCDVPLQPPSSWGNTHTHKLEFFIYIYIYIYVFNEILFGPGWLN